MSEKKHLLLTVSTAQGVVQRRLIPMDRYCSIQEVDTDMGRRTLVKFLPDPVAQYDGPDRERPIFALETMDQIIEALGDSIIKCKPKRKPRAR